MSFYGLYTDVEVRGDVLSSLTFGKYVNGSGFFERSEKPAAGWIFSSSESATKMSAENFSSGEGCASAWPPS